MNKYWEDRYLNQSLKVFNSSEEYVRWLRNQYEATLNSINEDIYSHLSKIAKDNQVSLVDAKKYLNKNELKAFKWKLSKFKDAAKKGGYDKELNTIYHRQRISRLQAMEYEMNLHLYKLMDEEERQLFRKLGQNYKATYQDELNNLNDIFSKNHLYRLNEKALDKVINEPWSPDGSNFSARIWERRDKLADVLKTNMVQGIIRGDSIDKIAKNIEKSMGAGLNNAKRLARTEINAVHTKARTDAFKDYNVDKVEICAKLDSRTSDICRGLDGKVIALKDVKSGITGPPFHPNCRTVLIPYIDDEIQKEIERSTGRMASDPVTGKSVNVGDLSYKEWYNKYVKANPEAVFKEQAWKHRHSDKDQFIKYKDVLGKDLKNNFKTFQELKYNDEEKYKLLKVDYKRRKKLIDNPDLLLPNVDKATIDDRKFTEYLFGGENEDGLNKGRLIEKKLGYNIDNYLKFKKEILKRASIYPSRLNGERHKGKRYEQKIFMYDKEGNPVNLIIGWYVEDSNTKMTTIFIKEVSRNEVGN